MFFHPSTAPLPARFPDSAPFRLSPPLLFPPSPTPHRCLFRPVRRTFMGPFMPSAEEAINPITTRHVRLGDQTYFTWKSEEALRRGGGFELEGVKSVDGIVVWHLQVALGMKVSVFKKSRVTHCSSPAHNCSSDPMHASISSRPPLACEGLNS